MCGEGAATDRMCQNWFGKFRAGDLSLDDAPGSVRPGEVDSDQIKTLIENNKRMHVLLHGRQPTYSKYPNQCSSW